MKPIRRVAVGMSGGVDSSVTALLLAREGFEVIGVTMSIYGGAGGAGAGGAAGGGAAAAPAMKTGGACYGPDEQQDIEDAAAVCRALGIPHHVVDLRAEYQTHVLDYFRREYTSGRTPNPCVRCNQVVKFGLLMERLPRAAGFEIDAFATGHYARVSFDGEHGRFTLSKGTDSAKDQSYFLCMLSQEQLSRVLFPLGGLTKTEVRRIALEARLSTGDKPDSQNFVGSDYRGLLGDESSSSHGHIKDSSGQVLGDHKGIWSYTIGQRKGLGIAAGEPLYVTRIEGETNTVFVGPAAQLLRGNLTASHVNWSSIQAPTEPFTASVRIRYQHKEASALVSPRGDGSIEVAFRDKQRSIAAGQWAVIYDGERLLGGGNIEESW